MLNKKFMNDCIEMASCQNVWPFFIQNDDACSKKLKESEGEGAEREQFEVWRLKALDELN